MLAVLMALALLAIAVPLGGSSDAPIEFDLYALIVEVVENLETSCDWPEITGSFDSEWTVHFTHERFHLCLDSCCADQVYDFFGVPRLNFYSVGYWLQGLTFLDPSVANYLWNYVETTPPDIFTYLFPNPVSTLDIPAGGGASGAMVIPQWRLIDGCMALPRIDWELLDEISPGNSDIAWESAAGLFQAHNLSIPQYIFPIIVDEDPLLWDMLEGRPVVQWLVSGSSAGPDTLQVRVPGLDLTIEAPAAVVNSGLASPEGFSITPNVVNVNAGDAAIVRLALTRPPMAADSMRLPIPLAFVSSNPGIAEPGFIFDFDLIVETIFDLVESGAEMEIDDVLDLIDELFDIDIRDMIDVQFLIDNFFELGPTEEIWEELNELVAAVLGIDLMNGTIDFHMNGLAEGTTVFTVAMLELYTDFGNPDSIVLPREGVVFYNFVVNVGPPVIATNWSELAAYIANVNGPERITIRGSFPAGAPITIPVGRNITLVGEGPTPSVLTQTNSGQRHFVVQGNANNASSLTLENNVTLSGGLPGNTNNSGGVQVGVNGNFKMNAGSVIENCRWAGSTLGGGVVLGGGNAGRATFTLAGGTIQNNRAGEVAAGGGGGVNIGANSDMLMTSGLISNNSTAGNGGGVRVGAATFTMRGGVIEGNTATNGAGVMLGGTGSEFTKLGGAIRNNTANLGGGVRVNSGARFVQHGFNQVYNNTPQNVSVQPTGTHIRILTDAETGISFEFRGHLLPENVELFVGLGRGINTQVFDISAPDPFAAISGARIEPRVGDVTVQPSGDITVRIPMRAEITADMYDLRVEVGSRLMDTRVEGRVLVFETDSFAFFVF